MTALAADWFSLSPDAVVQLQHIGHEQVPVLVIDNAAADLKLLRDFAVGQAQFQDDEYSYYPGVRANLPKEYVIAVLSALYGYLQQAYSLPAQLRLQPKDLYYSLITRQPAELSMLQRLPHFDATSPYYFALVHYLADGAHGGTGFFTHLPTGFQRILPSREASYLQSAQGYIAQNGQPSANYPTGSDGHYALYHQIAYKPNRLLLYPGNLLHSALVDPANDICSEPAMGRLTSNIFMLFA
jgi:hypothetical protein